MSENLKYIYGVIRTGQSVNFGQLASRLEVYTVCFRDIAIVLADRHPIDFTSLPKPELIRELTMHQAVVEEVMKENVIVPFKLGTFVEDDAEVISVLKKGYEKFCKKLEAIEGKIELELIALWNMDIAISDVYLDNLGIRELQKEIISRTDDETLEDKIRLGQMVASALAEKRDWYIRKIRDEMQKYAHALCENVILDESMVANLAFLLERQNEAEFEKAVQRLDEASEGRLNFRCIGPLPPYTFSTLEIKRISWQEIEKARRVIGVDQQAGPAQIKQAYRKLLQKFHPDNHGRSLEAEALFKKITEAYTLLNECSQNNYEGSDSRSDYLLVIPVKSEIAKSGSALDGSEY